MGKFKPVSNKRYVGVNFEHELYDALKARAVSENRSVSNMMAILITQGVTTALDNDKCLCVNSKKTA